MNRCDSNEHDGLSQEDSDLHQALLDVPIPPGLEERLLAATAVNASSTTNASGLPNHRRAWLYAAAGGLGAAALGAYYYSALYLPASELRASITDAVQNRLSPDWTSMQDNRTPLAPKAIRRPNSWQIVRTSLDREAVAFDITPPGAAHSVLFSLQVHRRISHYPTAAPDKLEEGATGSWRLAIWRKMELNSWGPNQLFVLACNGTDRDYRRLIVRNKSTQLA